jgi:hypothetical protein
MALPIKEISAETAPACSLRGRKKISSDPPRDCFAFEIKSLFVRLQINDFVDNLYPLLRMPGDQGEQISSRCSHVVLLKSATSRQVVGRSQPVHRAHRSAGRRSWSCRLQGPTPGRRGRPHARQWDTITSVRGLLQPKASMQLRRPTHPTASRSPSGTPSRVCWR